MTQDDKSHSKKKTIFALVAVGAALGTYLFTGKRGKKNKERICAVTDAVLDEIHEKVDTVRTRIEKEGVEAVVRDMVEKSAAVYDDLPLDEIESVVVDVKKRWERLQDDEPERPTKRKKRSAKIPSSPKKSSIEK